MPRSSCRGGHDSYTAVLCGIFIVPLATGNEKIGTFGFVDHCRLVVDLQKHCTPGTITAIGLTRPGYVAAQYDWHAYGLAVLAGVLVEDRSEP